MARVGKKRSKIDRNRAKCATYRSTGQREANKARRIAKDARRAR
jgi:hypothetical protein